MFDHLDMLDDATPPVADNAMLEKVHGRALRLRRRSRVSAIAAGVAVLAVAAGVTAVTRHQTHAVSVITPPSTSDGATTTTKSNAAKYFVVGMLPNGLTVRMNYNADFVQLGADIKIDVVVTNETFESQTIGVGPIQCVLGVGLVLRDDQGHIAVNGIQNTGCDDMGRILKRNQTLTIPASLSSESVRLPDGATEARFQLRLESDRGLTNDAPSRKSIGPMPIFVRAPNVTARLVVPVTTAHPGAEIKGTLEIDNHGQALNAGCASNRPYDVFFSINGVALEPAQGLVGVSKCEAGPLLIRPGISRYPFAVYAQYYDCSSAGNASPSAPRCIGTVIPPLPAGRYEIRFRGIGPLSAAVATPVAIIVAG